MWRSASLQSPLHLSPLLSVWCTSELKYYISPVGSHMYAARTASLFPAYIQVPTRSHDGHVISNHSNTLGIKFIPLRTPGGELIHESGLFVGITMTSQVRGRQQLLSEDSVSSLLQSHSTCHESMDSLRLFNAATDSPSNE